MVEFEEGVEKAIKGLNNYRYQGEKGVKRVEKAKKGNRPSWRTDAKVKKTQKMI